MLSNYHTHTLFSDGHADLLTTAHWAEAHELKSLGFSDHAPLPFLNSYAMQQDRLRNYSHEIDALKMSFPGGLEILKGLEIDYIPGVMSPSSELFNFLHLDYRIGAVHYVNAFEDGRPWSVDGTTAGFAKGLDTVFGGDIRAVVERYFDLQIEMIQSAKPDILAHMDRIKKHNYVIHFFDTDSTWYLDKAEQVIDALAANNVILEINTKGRYSNGEPEFYPSRTILEMARDKGCRVHPASDAHHPRHLRDKFSEVLRLLADIGFASVAQFGHGQWHEIPLPTNALSYTA